MQKKEFEVFSYRTRRRLSLANIKSFTKIKKMTPYELFAALGRKKYAYEEVLIRLGERALRPERRLLL